MAPAGLLVLRVAIAIALVPHGAHWLFGAFAGDGMGPGGLTTVTAFYAATGLAPAFVFAVTAGTLQFVGGTLLALGVFTRMMAGMLILAEVIKIYFDSARWGFFLNWTLDTTRGHGMEYSVLILGVLSSLALAGGGDWSFDGLRARSTEARVAGRARIRERG
jgi:putative oxidoreductase